MNLSNMQRTVNRQSGMAMLTSVIFFLAISLTVVLGVATPILKQAKVSKDAIKSKESYYLAEGALEDALFRVKTGKALVSGDTVVVNGYTTTLALTTTIDGKIIEATSNRAGIVRKMQAKVVTSTGAAFNYGIQVGTGGFTMSGGSRINGNVYSNGSIIATGGVTITGTAVAANPSSPASDQSNATPTPIGTCTSSTCITFRNTSATQDIAQSFIVSTSSPIYKVRLYIKKVGNPSDSTVRIVTNNSGSPSTSNLLTTNGTLSASLISTSFGWVDVTFPTNPTLSIGETYWFVLDNSSQNASNYYVLGANSSYASGQAKIGAYNGTWNNTTPTGLDTYFDIYLGDDPSVIGSGTYVGSVNIGGDAWARSVVGASVTGSLYCQTGTTNNKVCTTTRPDPSPSGYPVSDSNISDWKDDASAIATGWTYTGNLTIGSAGTTTTTLKKVVGNLTINGGGIADLTDIEVTGNIIVTSGARLKAGPMKVGGTLTVGSNGLTVKGTIWVVGDITVSSGGAVSLDSSYGTNSGIIITDGKLSLTGGGAFSGSGQTGSYPFLITTSNCPTGAGCAGVNAVEFSGGAGAVILYAPNGTLHMSGGTSARALTANKIVVDGGGTVTYDTGLADITFSSGPSGGWEVQTWKEIQ